MSKKPKAERKGPKYDAKLIIKMWEAGLRGYDSPSICLGSGKL